MPNNERDAKLLLDHAVECLKQGNIDFAVGCCIESIRRNPADPAAYYYRGLGFRAQGELQLAIQDFSQCLRLDPGNALAYFKRADARWASGDLDGAVADCTASIKLNPADSNRGTY
jgi:tetratricopeptide (TPR) repeat protein